MEPQGSLLYSQDPATHPYPEPDAKLFFNEVKCRKCSATIFYRLFGIYFAISM